MKKQKKPETLSVKLGFDATVEMQQKCDELAFAMARSFMELLQPCVEQRAKQWVACIADNIREKKAS